VRDSFVSSQDLVGTGEGGQWRLERLTPRGIHKVSGDLRDGNRLWRPSMPGVAGDDRPAIERSFVKLPCHDDHFTGTALCGFVVEPVFVELGDVAVIAPDSQ
jgi:hypothetical protein